MIVPVVVPLNRTAAMAVYTVHEPPKPAFDRLDRAETLVFLRDGFAWSPALLGPIWLVMNRLWIALAAYAAAAAIIVLALKLFGAGPAWATLMLAALNILVGFEGNEWERQQLDAKGWTLLGSVTGKNLAEAERNFFERWLPSQPMLASAGSIGGTPSAGDAMARRHVKLDKDERGFLKSLLGSFGIHA